LPWGAGDLRPPQEGGIAAPLLGCSHALGPSGAAPARLKRAVGHLPERTTDPLWAQHAGYRRRYTYRTSTVLFLASTRTRMAWPATMKRYSAERSRGARSRVNVCTARSTAVASWTLNS